MQLCVEASLRARTHAQQQTHVLLINSAPLQENKVSNAKMNKIKLTTRL